MLSKDLTNPVFIEIALGASQTYSYWRRTSSATSAAREWADCRGPASKDQMILDKKIFFNIIF